MAGARGSLPVGELHDEATALANKSGGQYSRQRNAADRSVVSSASPFYSTRTHRHVSMKTTKTNKQTNKEPATINTQVARGLHSLLDTYVLWECNLPPIRASCSVQIESRGREGSDHL